MMEKEWICVYRDTIEEHDEIDNLAYVQVTREFVEQYVRERQNGLFKDVEEFFNEYTADNTVGFGIDEWQNGTNVNGMPYVDLYSDGNGNYNGNINNYIRTETVRIVEE